MQISLDVSEGCYNTLRLIDSIINSIAYSNSISLHSPLPKTPDDEGGDYGTNGRSNADNLISLIIAIIGCAPRDFSWFPALIKCSEILEKMSLFPSFHREIANISKVLQESDFSSGRLSRLLVELLHDVVAVCQPVNIKPTNPKDIAAKLTTSAASEGSHALLSSYIDENVTINEEKPSLSAFLEISRFGTI
jgi:hypothetical protein